MLQKFALIGAAMFAAFFPLFGRDVYVSSSTGDDKNDGSISAPLRTIAAAPKDGANVYLKRGDVFFESLSGFKNSEIDAYGEGKKPLVCGLKILKDNGAWERLPSDVWRLDLSKHSNFDGYKAAGKTNNIGAIYYPEEDKIYGHLVQRASMLAADGDFWAGDAFYAENVQSPKTQFKYIYFRSKRHPSELGKTVSFVTYSYGIRDLKNCIVRNVAVKGFGVHGVSRAWNCRFENLEIDLIGGSVQLSYPQWVRLGNGVEFWISPNNPCNNNSVSGCKISRTYDCGATIQGHGDTLKAENIKFTGNHFFRCRQAFEHFLTAKKSAAYANCEFSNNKCFDMGENEFSTPESRDANLLSYERNPIEGLSIKNNIFWGAPVYALHANPAKLENNTFYVYRGQYLRHNRGKPEETIWADSEGDIEKFKSAIGDVSDKFVIVERSDTRLRREVLESAFAPQREKIERKTREKYRRDSFFRK